MTAKGTYFPRRINSHVPNMQYAADVRYGGLGTIVIPAMPAAAANNIAAALSGAAGKTASTVSSSAKFGRNVTVTASVATGAASTVIIRGKDYLGQPMSETISVANAVGTTPQVGIKAFKHIESIEVGVATTGATFNIGFGNALGLPYKAMKLVSELVYKAVPGNAGAITAGIATGTVQSNTTGDTRGTYTPHSSVVPDGTRSYELNIHFDTDNLHGDAHFYA